jgi:tetratricopeptide (TPR) repeat protein
MEELKKVETMARTDRYEDALRRLDKLAVAFPVEVEIWATRAYVNGRQGERAAAIADWTKAIGLCDKEPHYFYMRGSNYFRLGQFRKAVSDFTKVIELCDFYNSDYYREPAYFFRADAHVRLKEFEKAKADCMHLRDELPKWTDKLRTKAEIITECSN